MKTLALLHAAQLVTLAGPKRPRVGAELSNLSIISDGGMLVRDGVIDCVGPRKKIEKKADYSWHSLIGRCPREC